MNKKTGTGLSVLAVAIVAIVLIGEYAVYADGLYRYDADVQADGAFTVSASGSENYSVVLTDNGGFTAVSSLYIYYDSSYGSNVKSVTVEIGAKGLTQDYYLSQLVNTLKYRGLTDVTYVNAEELAAALAADAASGTTAGKGLVVINGALPDTVYTGSSGDLILTWIHAGGSLYWAGGLLGAYVAHSDKTVEAVTGDYQCLFFTADCLNTSETVTAFSEIAENSYRQDLSLMNNVVTYGVATAKLTAGTYLAAGYTENGYASIACVQCGNGMVCIMGGDYSNNQRSDLATVICAGLCWSSQELDCQTGSVTRGTANGDLTVPSTHGKLVAYALLGGCFSVYGKSFTFESS